MKLLDVTSPDQNNPERIGIVVEPHPNAPHRAFAQLAEGSDWHEMTMAGALAGGVFPTRKGVGQKLEHLALAWKLGRAQAVKTHLLQNSPQMPAPLLASGAPGNPPGGLMAALAAMLAGAARGSQSPGSPALEAESELFGFEGSPQAPVMSWDALDITFATAVPEPPLPQLPATEPPIDGADVRKDCDEFDQSLEALSAHLDEARYRAGGL